MIDDHNDGGGLRDDDALFGGLESTGLFPVFFASCEHAYDWLRGLREAQPDINFGRIRTQRCLANDAVLRRVKAALADWDGLEFREVPNAECEELLVGDPRCTIRFKKIDRLGQTSNILTGRQKKLRGSAGQRYMFAGGGTPVLTVGYEPDDELCRVSRVSIAVEGGGSYRIAPPPADTIGEIKRVIRTRLGEETA